MLLSYGKYLDLLSALDEHCKGSLTKAELQNAIFNHYADKYGSFVAENINKVKTLFTIKYQKTKNNKAKRKLFRSFMDQSRHKKKKK